MPKRIQFGIDLDDTTGDFMRPFLRLCGQEYGREILYRKCWTYHLGDNLGLPDTEALRMLDIYSSTQFATLPFIPGARKAIQYLSEIADVHVLTARHVNYEQQTREWLKNNFPFSFASINFTHNRFAKGSQQRRKKAEIAAELKLDYMAEDHADYAHEISQAGVHVFLLRRPWNRHVKKNGHGDKITICRGWKDIIDKVREKHRS